MHVEALFVHPVKACRAVAVDRARVERRGLEDDRRFMVVDGDGTFLSQRAEAALALVRARLDGDALRLAADGIGEITIPRRAARDATRRTVRVHSSYVGSAWSMGGAARSFFSALVGREAELVAMPDDEERSVHAKWSMPDARVSYADAFPLLLASSASLEDLVARARTPIAMARFRPNVVVTGASAWDEDRWARVRIGGVTFAAPKLCDRCVVTTIDQTTAERGAEPLKTLATFRRWDDAVWFGTNLVPEHEGEIAVGDVIEVLDRREARSHEG